MTTVQTSANQYVWIPVENPSDMYGTDENGNKLGKLYNFENNGDEATNSDQATHLNWYEEITDEEIQNRQEEMDTVFETFMDVWNGASEEEKAILQEMYGITNEEDIIKLFGQKITKESLYSEYYREPACLSNSSYADDSQYNVDANGNKIITEDVIKSKFNKMINSVETYKGFYIGRYELTGTVEKPTVVKGAMPLTADVSYSVNEKLRWYGLYTMCEKLEQNNTDAQGKVTTSMIWGSQWDQAVKKSLENKSDFLTNADTYGEYSYSKTTSGTKVSVFNIYDMSGNVEDWTLEANYSDYRVLRGRK